MPSTKCGAQDDATHTRIRCTVLGAHAHLNVTYISVVRDDFDVAIHHLAVKQTACITDDPRPIVAGRSARVIP